MGWWITLGVFVLLAILPLGVSVKYSQAGPLVRLILGPIHLTLLPKNKKAKKPNPKAEEKKAQKEAQRREQKQAKKQAAKEAKEKTASEKVTKPLVEEKGGSITDFLPLVKVLGQFLNGFRKKLRVKVLNLKLTMAADDPCDLAVNYGKAWAALGNLMPQLERIFVIKKRNLEVACDFTASQTLILARLDLTITLGRLISLVAVTAFRALKTYLNIKKKRKGGAQL